MWLADTWRDYEVLDCGDGEKLERWGETILLRPDPQAIWPAGSRLEATTGLNAHYHRSASGGGEWEVLTRLQDPWQISYRKLTFEVGLMGFKHTGLFPEQAVNWDWMGNQLQGKENAEVLNLFGYTGAATVACAAAGAKVVHVDASKGMTQWAKRNLSLNLPENRSVRWIVEDCLAFVKRELRRGRKYQGILMDPPSYGRGPNGQTWKLEDSIYELLQLTSQLLAEDACFFLLNSYTTGLQSSVLSDLLKLTVGQHGGKVTADELGLPVSRRPIVLPCGASGRWVP
jgi:23S rRNA (cytosine1962-C5)-methyltransferase